MASIWDYLKRDQFVLHTPDTRRHNKLPLFVYTKCRVKYHTILMQVSSSVTCSSRGHLAGRSAMTNKSSDSHTITEIIGDPLKMAGS